MKIIRIDKFVQEPDDELEWLVEGLLPNVGWTLFSGKRGVGKTTFAAQLCDALQTSKPFLGRKTQQTNVAYVQADSPRAVEWKAMLKRICPGSKGWTVINVPSRALDNVEYVKQLCDLIYEKIEGVEKTKIGYIVFDSLYSLSKEATTQRVLDAVETMKLISGPKPFMLIHHPPHDDSRAAGHHSLSANCSNDWFLLKTKLRIDKGRLVKEPEILLDKDEDGLWFERLSDLDDDLLFR
jgi:archaellum biogenesis ATPase FlaH